MSKRFLLLDRDGTLIEECDYLSRPEQVRLIPGAGETLARFQSAGWGLVLVTNQSGIARGYFTTADVDLVHQRLQDLLTDYGVQLDGIYVCPHGPSDGCDCRKPRTGLVDQAKAQLGFDPSNCVVVGDKSADIELGRAVGAKTVLVRTGYGKQSETEVEATLVVDNLGHLNLDSIE
jgi:D-glycero-D-manno-heptose 1,7-bisphosphate phosphatase